MFKEVEKFFDECVEKGFGFKGDGFQFCVDFGIVEELVEFGVFWVIGDVVNNDDDDDVVMLLYVSMGVLIIFVVSIFFIFFGVVFLQICFRWFCWRFFVMIKFLWGLVLENVCLFIYIYYIFFVNSIGGLCIWFFGLIFLLVCIFNGVIIFLGFVFGYL